MGDPALAIATPMIKLLLEKTSSLVKEELLSFRGIDKDVEHLSSNLTSIQAVLQDAEEKQHKSAEIRVWLQKLQNAAYDAVDILDLYAAELYAWKRKRQHRKFQWLFSSLAKASIQNKAAKDIKEVKAKIDMIAKEKKKFHLNQSSQHNMDPPETSFVLPSEVVGRKDDKNNIIDKLLSAEFDKEGDVAVLPITGMGGLGKTTLAQLAYSDERVKAHFDSRMWVCVTVNFDSTKIIRDMVKYHSKMVQDIDLLSLPLLHSRLLEFLPGTRFLLILDDVWTEKYEDWDSIKQFLHQGKKGSRVLVTSRSSRVAEIMGTLPPHRLEDLPQDECWSLFQKIALTGVNLAGNACQELEEIGKEIVSKCKGLPLAVKAMAGLLRGVRDKTEWRRIKQSEIWGNETGVLPALRLSYEYLPPHLKQCFTYCYVFPKGYMFNKRELVKLWLAEAFVRPYSDQERLEETGIAYFNQLLMRSFFQHVSVNKQERYRMHDLIHDLAASISTPNCCQVTDEKLCHLSKDTRHVSIVSKDVDKPLLEIIDKSKKLRSLLMPTDHLKDLGQCLDKLFLTLSYLRVLDLNSSALLELPKSIEKLKLLQYLDLSRTEIKMLPNSICSLYNLQTLKLLGCLWLSDLPEDLHNLINLQNLELDEMFWYKFSTLPPNLGKLTTLQNLHTYHVGRNDDGRGIRELQGLNHLTGSMQISQLENAENAYEANLKDKASLNKLVLEWGDSTQDEASAEIVLENLKPHSKLEELQICCYKGTRFPSWLGDGGYQNLVSISLKHCTKCRVLSLNHLPRLVGVNIKGMLELEEWPDMILPNLQRLKISDCPKLKDLPPFFPNLGVLKIKRCNSLKALPLSLSLQFLILIENDDLENWHNKAVRVHLRNEQGQDICVDSQRCLLGVLELTIYRCPKIQALPQVFAPQKLEISGCDLLNALPSQQYASRFQHLALDSCPDTTLVKAIPETGTLYSLVISNISKMLSLPKWPNFHGLKALYIRDCNDLISLFEDPEGSLQGLASVKLLSIQGCPKLVSLPEEGLPLAIECLSISSCPSLETLGHKEALKRLTCLKDVNLENCSALESLPEEGLPDSIKHLRIEGCALLKQRCRDGGPDWSKIKHVPDLEIDCIRSGVSSAN